MSLRALGGGELEGDRLVRLVYIDEAGTGDIRHEPFLTVAAVIVHGDHILGVHRELDKIRAKYIAQEHRGSAIFHAKEMFGGSGKVFRRKEGEKPLVPFETVLKIADEIASIPSRLQLWVTLGWVDRRAWPRHPDTPNKLSRRDHLLGCHATAFFACAALVESWMRRHAKRENCLMIVEDNNDARALLRETQRHYQTERALAEVDEERREFFPFKHIQEDPLFQPKRSSSVLEVADFCAYVWKRYLMNEEDERWLRFLIPWRKRIGDVPKILRSNG